MSGKLRIAIVGSGALGSVLAVSLHRAAHTVEAVFGKKSSLKSARALARKVKARAASIPAKLEADVVWFCVPDSEITHAAQLLRESSWNGRIALHSSGALTSDELGALRKRGAAVASVHPMMTFVKNSRPSLAGVPFAIEGDARAVRAARSMVKDLGGLSYSIEKRHKAAYHAWGTFASPLLTAMLATTEHVARLAGLPKKALKQRMIPILLQTLVNYAASEDAGDAFSGPIMRGDVETIRKHLQVLRKEPVARGVYIALARAALEYLPARNRELLKRVLDS